MQRRVFIVMLGAAAVVRPMSLRAQQPNKVYRVGFLWDRPTVWPHALEAFHQRLRDLGWVEGKSLIVEYRWAEGQFDRLPALTEELIALKVDVIVAPTSIYTGVAKRATSAIPIVFASHADPIGSGHVASLARPGGNITGFTIMMSETTAKSLELLKEAVPGLSRVAVILDPATPSHRPGLEAVEVMARALGLEIQSVPVGEVTGLDSAFLTIVEGRADAVVVLSTPLFMGAAQQLAELALKHKLPSMFGPKEHVDAGGLMSYSPDRADLYARAATYVDMILKGANPGELPVQQATKFDLVINLKTADVLGLEISPAVLARATEVIE